MTEPLFLLNQIRRNIRTVGMGGRLHLNRDLFVSLCPSNHLELGYRGQSLRNLPITICLDYVFQVFEFIIQFALFHPQGE